MVTIPNCITVLRIGGAFGLLFVQPFTPLFYAIYSLCGLSDVLDGAIARATGKTTDFGAKLDTISDLVFYAVMLVHILPTLWKILPKWIWIGTPIIVAMRLVTYLMVALKFHRLGSLHTYLNKLTGAGIFCFPYAIAFDVTIPICVTTFVVSALAAVEDLVIHICMREYRYDVHTIFQLGRKEQS